MKVEKENQRWLKSQSNYSWDPAERRAGAISVCCGTAVTTMMAQNFHWNVTGMAFGPLHALFQEIYEDHFTAQDDLAERIRTIGHAVDGRLHSMIGCLKGC